LCAGTSRSRFRVVGPPWPSDVNSAVTVNFISRAFRLFMMCLERWVQQNIHTDGRLSHEFQIKPIIQDFASFRTNLFSKTCKFTFYFLNTIRILSERRFIACFSKWIVKISTQINLSSNFIHGVKQRFTRHNLSPIGLQLKLLNTIHYKNKRNHDDKKLNSVEIKSSTQW